VSLIMRQRGYTCPKIDFIDKQETLWDDLVTV
jgi:hypothetical protein